MIQFQDVRIGNLLLCNDRVCRVTSVSSGSVETDASQGVEGPGRNGFEFRYLPLSAEWMSRFSGDEKGYIIISELEKESTSSDLIVLSTVECYLHNDGFLRVCAYEYERYPDGSADMPDDVITLGYEHIRYVHQLQNLYYLLTGKELEMEK